MSADNGIYILSTVKTTKLDGVWHVKCPPYTVYRVAYASAIDNFGWYKENQLYNLGAYLMQVWGKSKVYESYDDAFAEATKLAEQVSYLEYGISNIEIDMIFFGDD
jgi:hypothetical protein